MNFNAIKMSAWLFTSNLGLEFLHQDTLETLDKVVK